MQSLNLQDGGGADIIFCLVGPEPSRTGIGSWRVDKP
jgi:hypothetical protein